MQSPNDASDATPPTDDIVVVLNETQDLVNIAGTVRAMRNMGFQRLRLVRPAEFDAYRIAGIAHGSEDMVERIEFYDTLADAVADAVHVAGTTARRREASHIWRFPRQAAPGLVATAAENGGLVALVFGREDKGLANEDLDLCDQLIHIPTDPAASSLNLAQAVLLVCYEIRLARTAPAPLPRARRHAPAATARQLQETFGDIEQALAAIDFFKKRNPAAIMRTVRAIARRAGMNAREAKLVRAMAIEVRKSLDRLRSAS